MSNQASYLHGHRKSGLKVGDWVKVTRTAKSGERGWADSWVPQMNDTVSQVLEIMADAGAMGFYLRPQRRTDSITSYDYPHFVLRKVRAPVDRAPLVSIPLNSSYTAVVHPATRVVRVGCQSIPLATVAQVYRAIQRVKARGSKKKGKIKS